MKFKIQTITPIQAHEWLEECNRRIEKGSFNQRPPSKAAVSKMVSDIRRGNFILTHQPIAFDTKGNLIDGRQRLSAIVKSKTDVELVVATDVPYNHKKLRTIDIIDSGRNRTFGQVLKSFNNINSGHLIAGILRIIVSLVTKDKTTSLTKAQGFELYNLLKEEIELVINETSVGEVERRTFILAPLVLGCLLERGKTIKFAQDFCKMEGIKPGSPILALRRWLTTKASGASGSQRKSGGLVTCNALVAYYADEQLGNLGINFEGIDLLIKNGGGFINSINKIIS